MEVEAKAHRRRTKMKGRSEDWRRIERLHETGNTTSHTPQYMYIVLSVFVFGVVELVSEKG